MKDDRRFNQQAQDWFGMEVKTWIPTIIAIVGMVGFFVTQSNHISTLTEKAQATDATNKVVIEKLEQLLVNQATANADIQHLQNDVDAIKRATVGH